MTDIRKIAAACVAIIAVAFPVVLSTPFASAIGNGSTYLATISSGLSWLFGSPWLALPAGVLSAIVTAAIMSRPSRVETAPQPYEAPSTQ